MEKKLFKSLFFTVGLILVSLAFFACATTKTEEPAEPEEPAVVEEPVEEPEVYVEEDPVEEVEDVEEDDEEYLRSIDTIESEETVTKQEFSDDKTAILNAIAELSEIMENQDAEAWLDYIDPASITYYSNPANLRKAQKKLPNKLIELKTIYDYFKYVFIPSRKRSQVDEIRYISKTNIKAVEVKEDYTTVVYYYFKKINERWYVSLPTL